MAEVLLRLCLNTSTYTIEYNSAHYLTPFLIPVSIIYAVSMHTLLTIPSREGSGLPLSTTFLSSLAPLSKVAIWKFECWELIKLVYRHARKMPHKSKNAWQQISLKIPQFRQKIYGFVDCRWENGCSKSVCCRRWNDKGLFKCAVLLFLLFACMK